METFYVLLPLLFVIAFLYASVGHGGASGYLAVMALVGIAPVFMKPTALVLNLAVSLSAFVGFYQSKYFKVRLFIPFVLTSIPLAYLGGTMTLSDPLYKKILAICLLISIIRLVYTTADDKLPNRPIPLWGAILSGGCIGWISGLIGIGGGIILSPLMLLLRWGKIREIAAVSALFIFVNSLAGLVGQYHIGRLNLDDNIYWMLLATMLGGLLGSYMGSKKFNNSTLRYFLATVVILASAKLIFVH